MNRGRQWLEVILGLLIGLSLGLAISWWIAPNGRLDPSPAALRPEFKDEYRLLIAWAYHASGDLGRARVRLSLLKDGDPVQPLLDQAIRLRNGEAQSNIYPWTSEQSIYMLSLLANAIQEASSPQAFAATETLLPPRQTPTNTSAPFVLLSQEVICEPATPENLVRFNVLDNTGQPLAGVGILAKWEQGQEIFYTGLKPGQGSGYADFYMVSGTLYSIKVLPSSAPLSGLSSPECTGEDGTLFHGGYLLVFQQP